jgi:hypothetical protein
VRPEHLRLSRGANAIELAIRFVESLGSVRYAFGAVEGAAEDAVVQLPSESSIAVGETLAARVDPACAHLFDPQGRAFARPLSDEVRGGGRARAHSASASASPLEATTRA